MLEVTLRAIEDFFEPTGSNIVDELGIIDRQIKDLEITARKLKNKLLENGVGRYYGKHFAAEVQEYDRANISAVLVKEYGTTEFVQQVTQMQHVKAVVVKPLGA